MMLISWGGGGTKVPVSAENFLASTAQKPPKNHQKMAKKK